MSGLRLGLRLVVGGGREGWVRLVYMAGGVGIGVAVLLLALTAPHALTGRFDRIAWQDAAHSALSWETDDDPVSESVDGALFLAVSDYYDGRPMTRAYLAPLGADPPVPPGLDRAPGPGEVAVSPALRRLLESTPDDELDERLPGRVTLTIGPAGLAHDNDLVAIVGRTPEQLRDVQSVGEVHGFTGLRPPGASIAVFLARFLLFAALSVLVPVVVLIVMMTRVAWRQRERRLAAIRLVGATQTQISMVAAAEVGLAAVVGAAVGWALYVVGRRVLAATVTFQGGHFWSDDVIVEPRWLAAVLVTTPLLVLLTTIVSLRQVQRRPMAVARQQRRHPPSPWLAAPLVVGLAGQFAVLPFRDRLMVAAPDETPPFVSVIALLTLATVVGFVLAVPLLVAWLGRSAVRLSRSLPSLLAARRIVADPWASATSIAAVGLATVALTYFGCTVATAGTVTGPYGTPLQRGMVAVQTGGVPAVLLDPLRSAGYATRLPEAGSGPNPEYGVVDFLYVETDGSLAAENRVRTIVANLIPNAIVNSDRDPIDNPAETFLVAVVRLGAVAAFFIVIIGAFGFSAAMVGGLVERRRPFALLRASGVHLGELRRSVFLETAVTTAAISLAGAGVGMLLAFGASRQASTGWRWPGFEVFGLIGAGVLAAIVFSTVALPLLSLTTRPDAVRFE